MRRRQHCRRPEAFGRAPRARYDEAEAELQRAIALDPRSPWAHHYYALLLIMLGRTQEAEEHLRATLALAPNFVIALHFYGVFCASQGELATAVTMLERAITLSPGFPGVRAGLAHVYRQLGRATEAERLDHELEAAVTDERSRINRALGHAVAGRTDRAFEMLETARWVVPTLIELRTDPLLAAFREDERYERLLALHGLD